MRSNDKSFIHRTDRSSTVLCWRARFTVKKVRSSLIALTNVLKTCLIFEELSHWQSQVAWWHALLTLRNISNICLIDCYKSFEDVSNWASQVFRWPARPSNVNISISYMMNMLNSFLAVFNNKLYGVARRFFPFIAHFLQEIIASSVTLWMSSYENVLGLASGQSLSMLALCVTVSEVD